MIEEEKEEDNGDEDDDRDYDYVMTTGKIILCTSINYS